MDQVTEYSVSTGLSDIQLPRAIPKKSAWEVPSSSNAFFTSSDVSLFSSSLPVLRHEKLNLTASGHDAHFVAGKSYELKNLSQDSKGKTSMDDLGIQAISVLLPDDEDELLAGIAEEFDIGGLPSQVEELDEYDLFGSLGGLELDSDPTESISFSMSRATISENYAGNGINHYSVSNGVGTIAGEHPYGEHPSRTLFVRNINSNVEDTELHAMFEQYGDIRNLYTTCKHRGFVMISYYDIRAARTAMRALQNKPLRRRKLDIHFSIPKDNPSDKDINQGTLVIFNLEPSVTNDDLRQIFGVFGEVKEIRETPHKRHHKFIEFYDVRAAEAALKSLNKSDIAGKRIKLEPSRPGGTRRNLMQHLTHDFEQDESRVYRHHGGSPMNSSPPGTWLQFSSPSDNNSLQALARSPTGGTMSPIGSSHLPGLASVLPSMVSNSVKVAPIGKEQNRIIHEDQLFSNNNMLHGGGFQHSRSYPDHNNGMMPSSPGTLSSLAPSDSTASGIGTLTGPQFLWGSSTPFMEHSKPSGWQSRGMSLSHTLNGQGQGQNILYSSNRGSFLGTSHNQHIHHVGSAPSGLPFERHYGYVPESPETSFMSQVGFANMGSSRNGGGLPINMSPRAPINAGFVISGNMSDSSSPSFIMKPSHGMGSSFFGNAAFAGIGSIGAESLLDRGRNRRVDSHGGLVDNKKQYQLDIDKIIKGEDKRTTLMIKNIPNKYTAKMLLAAIDENHKGTYDFLYLPIDFKNKCNVGYAFINMVSPSHIISFYEAFNGKKWEKFNSEKVASLAYARIQGRAALVAHFQNSSLMNEDKRCRPILIGSDGLEAGEQVILDNKPEDYFQEAFQVSDLDKNTNQEDGINSIGYSNEGSEKSYGTEKSDKSAVP